MIIPIESDTLSQDNSQLKETNSPAMTNDIAPNSATTTAPVNNYLANSHSKLARSSTAKCIVGVVYIQEFLPHGPQQRISEEISIGTLILAEHRTVYASQLRQMIVQQALFTMDNNYIFLTNFGQVILST